MSNKHQDLLLSFDGHTIVNILDALCWPREYLHGGQRIFELLAELPLYGQEWTDYRYTFVSFLAAMNDEELEEFINEICKG